MQTKLTSALVRRVTDHDEPRRDTAYFDILVPRLALRVKPSQRPGHRWAAWYFVRYTAPDGTERRIKVGDPRTMSLDAARGAAKAMLAIVDTGGDPVRSRSELRAAWTVRAAVDAYTTSAEFAKKTRRTQAEHRATARLHIVHHIGSAKLAEVDVPSVRRLIRLIESDKRTNRKKRRLGGAGAARQTVRLLSAVMTWAVGEGCLERNSLVGNLRMTGSGQRTAILDRPEQYARLFATMDHMVGSGELRPAVRAFVIVVAATGMRRNEVRALRWGDVDLAGRRIVLRNPKGTKLAWTGAPIEVVSLPVMAAAALSAIRPNNASDADSVFPPVRGEMIAVNHDWQRIRAAAGLPADLVLHGLRHSLGTAGIVAGMSTAEVSKMLRHRNISVTQRYLHLAEASQSRLQDRAAAHLLDTAGAQPTDRSRTRS